MANWSPLREALARVNDRVTFAWADLDELVGGLPPSAYNHAAFWKGDRPGWPGFTTVDVRVGQSVTFVRRATSTTAIRPRTTQNVTQRQRGGTAAAVDIVLVGCVKTKLHRPAPARELYTSSLFRKARCYAESTGNTWFVLSAEHGLVSPDTVLQPYNLQLSETSREYRRAWGLQVAQQLKKRTGPLAGKVIEVHAGSAYADAIRVHLVTEGADVLEPLHGLRQGERLAWYGHHDKAPAPTLPSVAASPDVAALVAQLSSDADAVAPTDFLLSGATGLRVPGLYSWWVDLDGAATLSVGLRHRIEAGIIYAGLAGATRSRSGRKSTNSLWGRIRGMHLGSRHEFSTFRLSLGSILASARGESQIDESQLTAWMHEHLRLVAVPFEDADALNDVETAVLAALNPPLNLNKLPPSPVRERLSELRRRYGRTSR